MIRACLLVLMLCCALPASAHEVRPGYLEVNEKEIGYFDVNWKVPARGDMRLGIYVELPEHCSEGGEKLSDEELREVWLRQVQTKPADFLRAKFAYQHAMRQAKPEGSE